MNLHDIKPTPKRHGLEYLFDNTLNIRAIDCACPCSWGRNFHVFAAVEAGPRVCRDCTQGRHPNFR